MSSRVLGWAREDSGYPLEVAAKRAGVTVDQLLAWEAGEPVPMGKLRKLGTLYRRPLQFFMLAEPPKAREEVRDFRATRHEPTPALIQ